MTMEAWIKNERLSKERQNVVDQQTIDVYENIIRGDLTPEAAARKVSVIYEPIIKENPSDLRIASVWYILCSAVRALGSDTEVNERLVDLLSSIRKLPDVLDEHGNALTHEWGGRYWTDLPAWALAFREYGIGIDASEDIMEGEWLAQATPFLNANTFAATCLSRVPEMVDLSIYAEVCLQEAVEHPGTMIQPREHAAMFGPPAVAWIFLAGKRIYQLCKQNYKRDHIASGIEQSGFSLERWAFWKRRFFEIARSEEVEVSARGYARKASEAMSAVENEVD
ncbi:hypothetical protein BKA66DRAFT_513831 [Pyrenochaeta sp. MPI-SDFR-AT-0127]|nr:hypothetical protein BKA66DRAFT_513831 [Pyrenochaeta sp. MPI-SDFR-AT-0127]